jgi:hypothetical protein
MHMGLPWAQMRLVGWGPLQRPHSSPPLGRGAATAFLNFLGYGGWCVERGNNLCVWEMTQRWQAVGDMGRRPPRVSTMTLHHTLEASSRWFNYFTQVSIATFCRMSEPWSRTNVIDGGMVRTKGRRSCHDGGSTIEGITTLKVGRRRHHGMGTCVDPRLSWHRNNYKSWITIITSWPCT